MGEIADGLLQLKVVRSAGFVQCEILPFHSRNLPGKTKLAASLKTPEKLIADYLESLRAFPAQHHVVSLDATNRFDRMVFQEGWIGFKAKLIGFDETKAKRPYIPQTRGKDVSARFYAHKDGERVIGFCLMQGGNHFPGDVQGICGTIKDL